MLWGHHPLFLLGASQAMYLTFPNFFFISAPVYFLPLHLVHLQLLCFSNRKWLTLIWHVWFSSLFIPLLWISSLLPTRFLVIVVFQSLSCVQLFATAWIAAHQASLTSGISQSLLKFMSIEFVRLTKFLIDQMQVYLFSFLEPILSQKKNNPLLCTSYGPFAHFHATFTMLVFFLF